MRIRRIVGLTALVMALSATTVPALAKRASTTPNLLQPKEVVLIDTGIIPTEDGGAISAFAVSLDGD